MADAAEGGVEVLWLSGEVTCMPAGGSVRDLARELARQRGLPDWASVRLLDGAAELAGDEVVGGGRLTAVLALPRLTLTGGADRALRTWDLDSGACLGELCGHEGAVTALCADLRRLRALSGGGDGLRLWDLARMVCDGVLPTDEPVQGLAADFERHVAASCSAGPRILVWDLERRECTAQLRDHLREVTALVFGAGGSLLSASGDRTLRLWAGVGARDGQAAATCRAVLEGHTAAICSAAVDFERLRAASGSKDRTVRVWDMATRACTAVLTGLSWPVFSIAADFAQGLLVAGSGQGTLKVWNFQDCSEAVTLAGHAGTVAVAADFAAGMVVSGGEEGALKIWKLGERGCLPLQTLPGAHAGPVSAVIL